MNDAPKVAETPKTGRGVRILLAVSLSLNLLIVGVFVGAMLRMNGVFAHNRPPMQATMRELGYGPYGRALSREDQRAILEAMRDRADDFRLDRREIRAQSETLLKALRASPYRPEVVRAIIESQQARLIDRQIAGKDLLLERIERMSDAERRRYARRLEKVLTPRR